MLDFLKFRAPSVFILKVLQQQFSVYHFRSKNMQNPFILRIFDSKGFFAPAAPTGTVDDAFQ